MFRKFCESKANEKAELVAIKEDLEIRLKKALLAHKERKDSVDVGVHYKSKLLANL